jgi:transposase
MDAQSVKTVEESAGIYGFDAHKCVKGRKRHILVDTLGLLLAVYVTPADLHDGKGTRCPAFRTCSIAPTPQKDLGRGSRTVARSWLLGAKRKVAGISKSLRDSQALVGSASSLADGWSNEH